MQVVRHVANALSTIVLVALVALVIAFTGVRLAGLTPYAVLSGSMEPEFPVGSLIYVREADPESIQVGDAVTFEKSNGVIATHEAYEIDPEAREIRTQGIANVNPDGSVMQDAEPVPFESVIGVPVVCIPLLGYVNSFVTSPTGFVVVIAGVVAVIALSIVADKLGEGQRPAASKHMRQ